MVGNGLDRSVDEWAKSRGSGTMPTLGNNFILWHLHDDRNLGGRNVQEWNIKYDCALTCKGFIYIIQGNK